MEKVKNNYRELNIIWFSFIGFLLIYTVIVWIIHPFPLNLDEYLNLFYSFTSIPTIIKILALLGIGEFAFITFGKEAFTKIFVKADRKTVYLIAWAFCESIALYGLVGAFGTNKGIFYPPFLILSLIAFFVWKPKKSEIENENKEQPFSFE